MCPRRIYIKGTTAFRGVIREVICFLVVVVLFCKMCSFSTIFHRSRFDSVTRKLKKKNGYILSRNIFGWAPGFSDEITYLFQNCISLEDSEFPFGIIREVIYFFVVLFCKMSSFKTIFSRLSHVLIQSDKKTEKSLTSFKTAHLCKILNFLLRQSLIINPELVHIPLEKSRTFVLPYSCMRIPILRQNTLPSSLCLQSTVYENFSYASKCIVRSSHMIPYFCWDYWICRKEKLRKTESDSSMIKYQPSG